VISPNVNARVEERHDLVRVARKCGEIRSLLGIAIRTRLGEIRRIIVALVLPCADMLD
jgi:hypothetical protein